MSMILLIDNYDSFSYNLYQLVGSVTPDIRVIRNDAFTVKEIGDMQPDGLILSYPVITSGEKTHAESIANVMGDDDRVLKHLAAPLSDDRHLGDAAGQKDQFRLFLFDGGFRLDQAFHKDFLEGPV